MAGMFLASRRCCSSFSSSFPVFFNLLFFSCQQPLVDSASPFGAVTSHILPVRNFQGCQVAFSNIPETEQWTTYCTSAGGSPYKRSFGMRPSSIRETWPNQRSLRLLKIVGSVVRLVRLSTSSLVTLSIQEIPRIRRRQRKWKLFSLASCFFVVAHVSLL